MRYAGIDLRAALLRVLALAVAFAMALMWAAFVAEHAVYAAGTGTGAKNVLLIQTDHEFFYGYGTERDPGIIRENYSDFQSRAVSFPNAKSVCPLCSPARRSVLTGVYPHQQGILENQGSREMYAGVETIYDIYLENGWDPDNLYFFGKTHYSGTLMDVDTPITTYGIQGWAQLGNGYGNPYRTAEYRQYLIENDYFGCEEQYTSPVVRVLADSLNVNGTPSEGSLHVMGDMGFISGNIFGVSLTPKEYHEAYFLADMAKDSLRDIAASGQSEPFVMTVNIWGPHHPCYPTQEYVDLYTDENGVIGGGIEEYPSYYDDYLNKGKEIAYDQQGSDGLEQQLSWEQFRTYAALTYAQTTMVDDAIGTILDTLEETGLADDTIVIWTNDHGDALGSHGGHVDKDSYITEEVNAIAMAVYDPDLEEEYGGTECDALVNTLDVPVTMLGAYGLQFRNEEVTGMNMLDLIGNESLWRKYLVTEMNGHTNEVYTRVVYWKNYKYVYYFNDIDELYDLDADPYEMTNLIYEDSVSGVADLLKSYMYEWQLETGDIVPLINL